MLRFKDFYGDIRGNFTVMVGIGLSIVTLGTAAAIETTNMTRLKNELQSQVDIAALTAAATLSDDPQEDVDYASLTHDIMMENGFLASNPKPDVVSDGTHLNVTARVNYNGLLTELLGKKEYSLTASAQSSLPTVGKIELVLALDNTASMGFDGKIGALKIGAGKIVDAVKKSNSGTKVGIVPFARYINIGDASGAWLDTPAEYDTERSWQQATHSCESYSYEPATGTRDGVEFTYEKETCNGPTTTYETQTKIIESRFLGCVGTSNEPNHLSPISSTNRVVGLLNTQPKEVTGLYKDTEAWCPLAIRPLDDDYTEIGKFINEMFPVDVTYIPLGLLWAERLFDRAAPFDQAPKEEGQRQVMVLMSDGKNTAEIRDTEYYRNELRSPPYITDYRNDPERTVEKTDADTRLMCDRIKSKGIEIFTISFMMDDANARSLVKDCATSERHAFEAGSNDALISAFERIGTSMQSNVRLTK